MAWRHDVQGLGLGNGLEVAGRKSSNRVSTEAGYRASLSPWSWVLGTVGIYMNIEHLTEKKKVSLCVHSNTTYSSQNVDSSLDKLQQDVEHLWPTIQGNKLVLK